MRICDLCKAEKAGSEMSFVGKFNDVTFVVRVGGRIALEPAGSASIDICQECAAKAALSVFGKEPEKKHVCDTHDAYPAGQVNGIRLWRCHKCSCWKSDVDAKWQS